MSVNDIPKLHPTFVKYITDNLDPSVTKKLPWNCLEGQHPGQSCNQYKLLKFKQIVSNVLKIQMVIYVLPLVSRKLKDIWEKPKEELPKIIKGYFWAITWMTMGTWLSIVQLCHLHNIFGSHYQHWIIPMLSNFLGVMWVSVDYASRVKQQAVFMAPKAIEVIGNML